MPEPIEPKQPELELQIAQEARGGVWANFAMVSHSQYEFTIDFARLDYAQADAEHLPGVVVSRVNLSPLMVTQLMAALQENWLKYAQKAMPREVHDDGSTDSK